MYLKLRTYLLPFFVMVFSVFATAVQAQTTNAYTAAGLAAPTVTSDKDDYLPGEVAIITGKGWTLDSLVDIHLEEEPAYDHHHDYHDTKVNADGTWEIRYQIEERHLGVKFTVVVNGMQSGAKAYAYFTDGNYTTSISNRNVCLNTPSLGFRLTINAPLASFRSVSIPIPTGVSVTNITNTNSNDEWIAEHTSTSIQFRQRNSNSQLRSTITIVFNLTATTATPLIWNPNVYVTHNYSENRNDLLLINNTTTTERTVTVNPIPTSPITSSNSPVTVGGTLNLTSSTVQNATYNWTGPNNFTSTLQNPSITNVTAATAGQYAATATVNGCTSGAGTTTVVINSIVPTTLTISPATGTFGGTATLTATLSPLVPGKPVRFTLNGIDVTPSTAPTTNASGVATLANVSLAGINANTYATGVSASFAGDATHASSNSTGSLTISRALSTTTVTIPEGPFTYTGSPITPATVTVTGAGGISLVNAPVATYSNNINAGVNTASASYTFAGDNNHISSTDSRTFSIGRAANTISFTNPGAKTFGDAPFNLTASAISGAAVSFSVVSGNATISGNTLTITGAGDVKVKAASGETANFLAAADVEQTFNVQKAAQTITFASLANKTFGDAAFTLTSSTTSGLPINFSIVSGNATISGNTVTITGAGDVTVRASQSGDANYNAAVNVDRTFTVAKAAQTITFTEITEKTFGDAAFTIAPIASSGLAVSVTTTGGISYDEATGKVSITGAGPASITVAQTGNTNYNSAASVTRNFNVQKASQTITFGAITGKTFGDASFTLGATANSGLAVSYTISHTNVATVSGNTVTIIGAGTTTITATQAGNANYNEATAVSQELKVNKATATITLAGLSGQVYNGSGKVATATTSPANLTGVTISYSQNGQSVTSPTNAGTYTVTATLDNTNYAAIAVTGNLVISKATATLALGNLTHTYDGTEKSATATTTPANLDGVSISNNGKINADTYQVTATLDNANYVANNVTGTLVINKANATIKVVDKTVIYNGSVHGASVTATGAKGENLSSLLDLGANFINVPGGTANWSFAGNTNYNTASGTATITITPAPASITLSNLSKVYTGAAQGATVVTAPAGLAVNITYGGAATEPTNANTYAVIATLSDANYQAAPVTGSLVIAPKPLSVIVANKTKVYGTANPELTGTFSGAVASDGITVAYSTTATQTSDVVSGGYPITAILSDPNNKIANYSVTNTPAVLTITQAPATISLADLSKTYNGAEQGATITTSPAGLAVTVTYAGSATLPTNAGTYAVVAALNNGNYSAANGTGSLVIAKAPTKTVITVNGGSFTYTGAAITPATVSVTGAGGLNLAPAAVYTNNVNAGTATVSYSYAETANYLASSDSKIFTIEARQLTITAAAKSKVYGDADGELNYTITSGSLVGTDAFTGGLTRAAGETVGTYAITSTLANSNYAITFVPANLTITPKPITVTASNQSKIYGSAIALGTTAFTVPAGALVNGNTITNVTLTSTGSLATANAGSYDINASGAMGSGITNYAISYEKGTLTVDPKAITVTANNQSKTYGTALSLGTTAYSVPAGALVNGNTITGVTLASDGAVATASVNNYDITAIAATGTGLVNYTITYAKGTLTVGKAALTVTADPQTKVYGDANPSPLKATITGFVNGETLESSGVTGTPSVITNATANSPVGTSVITTALGTLASSNYSFTFVNSTLTITKAVLTVTADNRSRVYGDANPNLTSTITGFKNGQTLNTSGVTGNASITTSATTISPVGDYDINSAVGTLTSGNYAFVFEKGKLTITTRALTVTANNATKVYGAANPPFTVSYSGFVNGDVATSLGGTLAFITSASTVSAVGSYDVMPSGLTSLNYSISFEKGSLTVTPKAITLTANNQSKTYGTALNLGTTAFSVPTGALINGNTITGVTLASNGAAANAAVNIYDINASAATGTGLENYAITYAKGTLTINAADASIVYSGLEYFATPTASSTSAKVEYIATMTDNRPNSGGDVSTSSLVFNDGSNNITRNVILMNGNLKVGSARTGIDALTIGLSGSEINAGGKSFDLNVNVARNGNYTGGLTERTVITVAVPGQDFVNGGGNMLMSNSGGTYAAPAGSKMNFGFTMKWNSSGRNIQGQANIIFRSGGRVYQIKSNAINTLGTTTVADGRRADFNTKANMTDVTNPLAPVTISGNLDLSVQAFESTVTGGKDQISITLRSGTQLWFSSSWDGSRSVMRDLTGGAVRVRSNNTLGTPPTASALNVNQSAVLVEAPTPQVSNLQFNLQAYPNPSPAFFTLKLESNSREMMTLRIVDNMGKVMEIRNNLTAGQTVQVGATYRPGIYFAELIQGTNRKVVKLLKLIN